MKKANHVIAWVTAVILYAINPYENLRNMQQIALMIAYAITGYLFSMAIMVLATSITDARRKKKFSRMVEITTLHR